MKRIIVAIAALASLAVASPANADPIPEPSRSHPVVNIDSGPIHKVETLRTVYVERITPRYSYVQYNSGAAQFVRNCQRDAQVSCVRPVIGTMVLDDGSKVRLSSKGIAAKS